MDPIILFLKEDILLKEKSETDKVRRKAPWFQLSKDQKLYKRFFFEPYLPCINPETSELLLEELHEGICGNHTEGRSLSHRAITQGYWWPNMQKEAQEYVRSVINAKDLHQTYINQDESLILYLALGHLLNETWTLLALSPRQQGIRDTCQSTRSISLNGLWLNP